MESDEVRRLRAITPENGYTVPDVVAAWKTLRWVEAGQYVDIARVRRFLTEVESKSVI